MNDDARLLSEAERSARAARHARTEGRCVECGAPYTPGTWIILTDSGTVHRACLHRPDPIASKRRRPPKPATKFTASLIAARLDYVTAERSGRCPTCGDRWQAGETIAATGTRLVCGACGPSPVTTTMVTA